MASNTAVDSSSKVLVQMDSLAVIDLRLLSHSELYSLSRCCSSSSTSNFARDDELVPKIDRSVFNESANSRKQTYSRLRFALRKPQFPSTSDPSHIAVPRQCLGPLDDESALIFTLVNKHFAAGSEIMEKDANENSGTEDGLFPIHIEYVHHELFPDLSNSVFHNIPVAVVDESGSKSKRKPGRPRKNENQVVWNAVMVCENVGGKQIEKLKGMQNEMRMVNENGNVLTPAGSRNVIDGSGVQAKRKRGRPRKDENRDVKLKEMAGANEKNDVVHVAALDNVIDNSSVQAKRKRGRPRRDENRGSSSAVLPYENIGGNQVKLKERVRANEIDNVVDLVVWGNVVNGSSIQAKRKRGRPRRDENRGTSSAVLFSENIVGNQVKLKEMAGQDENSKVVDWAVLCNVVNGSSIQAKRKRGRPRRNENRGPNSAVLLSENVGGNQVRVHGNQNVVDLAVTGNFIDGSSIQAKRKRGRPRRDENRGAGAILFSETVGGNQVKLNEIARVNENVNVTGLAVSGDFIDGTSIQAKRKRGRPRRNENPGISTAVLLSENVAGNQVNLKEMTDLNKNDIVVDLALSGNVTNGSGMQAKRKRGRPRKNENRGTSNALMYENVVGKQEVEVKEMEKQMVILNEKEKGNFVDDVISQHCGSEVASKGSAYENVGQEHEE